MTSRLSRFAFGRLSGRLRRLRDEVLRPALHPLGYVPFRRDDTDAVVHTHEFAVAARCELGLPLPPTDMRVSLDYGRTDADYLHIGKEHVATMKAILARHGFEFGDGARILDLGCSVGRMIRWLRPDAARCRVVGADISAAAIHWCREHLGPPFVFVTTTLAPHLPFRDGTFDLVYAGSVFTHIDDLADTWLAEVARVLTPGGHAYLTIHDEGSMRLLAGPYRQSQVAAGLARQSSFARFRREQFRMFTLGRASRSQVFYSRAHFVALAAPWFEVRAFDEGAYLNQTAVTLVAKELRRAAEIRLV